MHRAYILYASETIHGISLVLSHPSHNLLRNATSPHPPLYSLNRRPVYAMVEIPISSSLRGVLFSGALRKLSGKEVSSHRLEYIFALPVLYLLTIRMCVIFIERGFGSIDGLASSIITN